MPLQATSGAASYDAFGGGVPVEPNYIESVFSTFLYTGNGSTQTINNGIDLAGKGGMVWIKKRSEADDHFLFDTNRGATFRLSPNRDFSSSGSGDSLVAFNSNGFNLDGGYTCNGSGNTLVSWTFREQPKFFDVVTFTGTQDSSGTGQVVSHNLGSTPGCVIIKPITDTSGTGFSIADWIVWHRSLPSNSVFLKLNSSASQDGNSNKIQAVSSTTFTAGWQVGYTGQQYVAYLFAHNAGGFGLTGTDNVISCGSFTTDGSGNASVTLGYEPQWLLVKRTDDASDWRMVDSMRGLTVGGNDSYLFANTSERENSRGVTNPFDPTATGFTVNGLFNSANAIYIAIRRGPMKVPTTGTSVFSPAIRTGTATTATVSGVGFPPDAVLSSSRMYANFSGYLGQFWDRLRGAGRALRTPTTAAEVTVTNAGVLGQDGYTVSNSSGGQNDINDPFVDYSFRRAPGFFDEVCYTGTGSARTISHNLGVAPELIIFKARSLSGEHWGVWVPAFGFSSGILRLSTNDAVLALSDRITGISATTVTVGTNGEINNSGSTYVMYLFASCPGVSKVGSYTGTGTTQTINCGFTGGARFVLIKATSTTGDWYVWDTARGMIPANDPYLRLNSTDNEVTGTDWVDTAATGFELSNAGGNLANSSGVSYIFLAIA